MAGWDRDIAGFSPAKRAVLEWYLRKANVLQKPAPCIVPIQPLGSKAPIFWMHSLGGGGGGGLLAYWALAQLLGPDQPSYGVASPAQPLTRIELMAAHAINSVRSIQPSGPYLLGGYCFGGVLAFEMARQMAAQRLNVGMVLLIESSLPPHSAQPSRASWGFARHFARNLSGYLAGCFRSPWRHRYGWLQRKLRYQAKRITRICRHESAHEGLSDLLDSIIDMSRYPQNFRYIARVHFEAYLKYVPQAYPGSVTLIRTQKPVLFDWNPEVLWAQAVRGGIRVKLIPGTHESILKYPDVQVLALEVERALGLIHAENLTDEP